MSFLGPGLINTIAETHFGPNVILDSKTAHTIAQFVQDNLKSIIGLAITIAAKRAERATHTQQQALLTTDDIHAAASIILEKELTTSLYLSTSLNTTPTIKRKYSLHYNHARGEVLKNQRFYPTPIPASSLIDKPDILPSIAIGMQGAHQSKLDCIERQQTFAYFTQTAFLPSPLPQSSSVLTGQASSDLPTQTSSNGGAMQDPNALTQLDLCQSSTIDSTPQQLPQNGVITPADLNTAESAKAEQNDEDQDETTPAAPVKRTRRGSRA